MKKHPRFDQINVIPYVDVLLVLLLVFMIAAPMVNQQLSVDLPEDQPIKSSHTQPFLRLVIDKTGRYQLAKDSEDLKPVSKKELAKRIGALSRKSDKSMNVQLEADKKTDYKFVLKALVALQNQGIHNISFIYSTK